MNSVSFLCVSKALYLRIIFSGVLCMPYGTDDPQTTCQVLYHTSKKDVDNELFLTVVFVVGGSFAKTAYTIALSNPAVWLIKLFSSTCFYCQYQMHSSAVLCSQI